MVCYPGIENHPFAPCGLSKSVIGITEDVFSVAGKLNIFLF